MEPRNKDPMGGLGLGKTQRNDETWMDLIIFLFKLHGTD